MMLAGPPVPSDAVRELARIVWDAGSIELADWRERALADEVNLHLFCEICSAREFAPDAPASADA